MRLPFTILITLLATLSYGQSLDGLRNRLKILEEPSRFLNDTTGFSSLPKIDYGCDNQNKIPSDNYHVVDLNGDGRKDLVYSGPCKNVTQSAIFLNTGRVFRKAYDNVGRVVSVEKVGSETKINIIKEASRCDFFSQYTEVGHQRKVTNQEEHYCIWRADKNICCWETPGRQSDGNDAYHAAC